MKPRWAHRGIVLNEPIGALAYLQLAARTRSKETRPKPVYNDFLMLWKDADPDIPILI